MVYLTIPDTDHQSAELSTVKAHIAIRKLVNVDPPKYEVLNAVVFSSNYISNILKAHVR